MGVAVISRNYAYPQRSCSDGESETDDDDGDGDDDDDDDVVCEMNDKPTCSGFKKYGNTAAAHTYTQAEKYAPCLGVCYTFCVDSD